MTTVIRNQGRFVRIGYAGVLLSGLVLFFILLLDQGQTLSVIQGEIAYSQQLVHELVHDARHTTAVPCH
ncbi:MAG: CbtB-domain containing protein [Chloroflexota bacterium]|nr:CbtB-domain containing protein [Chloroflexota bacterium]PLS80196.1 MAG: cobalt transporter [Chloroflexota bacterium]